LEETASERERTRKRAVRVYTGFLAGGSMRDGIPEDRLSATEDRRWKADTVTGRGRRRSLGGDVDRPSDVRLFVRLSLTLH